MIKDKAVFEHFNNLTSDDEEHRLKGALHLTKFCSQNNKENVSSQKKLFKLLY